MSILSARISWAVIRFIIGPILLVTACLAAFLFPFASSKPHGAVRDPKTRAVVDQRRIATALEAYFQDYGTYPGGIPLRDFAPDAEALRSAGGWDLMTLGPGPGEERDAVTPAGIRLYGLLHDPFTDFHLRPPYKPRYEGEMPYAYFHDGDESWLLISPGPDRDYDFDPEEDYNRSAESSFETFNPSILGKMYDPTNGMYSGGDVFRFKESNWRQLTERHGPRLELQEAEKNGAPE